MSVQNNNHLDGGPLPVLSAEAYKKQISDLEQQIMKRDMTIASLTVLTPRTIQSINQYTETERCHLMLLTLDGMNAVRRSIEANLLGSQYALMRLDPTRNPAYTPETRTWVSQLLSNANITGYLDARFDSHILHELVSNLVRIDIIDQFWM